MTHQKNNGMPTKAEVQTTKLNKMPVPGSNDTEFSAEESAEVFEKSSNIRNNNKSK